MFSPLRPAKYVMLITIDSLRPDHLGCYGYAKNISPNIDRLAERSIVFEQAIANAPYTKASFKSLMTSTYPFSFGGYHTIRNRIKLAEVLKQSGYYTVAFPTIPCLTAASGYADGFDVFKDPFKLDSSARIRGSLREILRHFGPRFGAKISKLYDFYKTLRSSIHPSSHFSRPYATGNLVTQEIIATLTDGKDKHLFIWAHYTDVHYPYNPPPQTETECPSRIPLKEIIKLERKRHELSNRPWTEEDKTAIIAELETLTSLYDGEIKYVDEQIGSLLAKLEEANLFQDTVIIITADHGEEFLEHGALGHVGLSHYTHMYDELLRVPLLISHPQLKKRLIKEQVSLLDLSPTIVDLLGLPHIKQFQGRSLLPLLHEKEDGERGVISEASTFNKGRGTEAIPVDDPKIVSYRTPDWKYIYNESGQDELYCLKDDPKETQNIINVEPAIAAELRAKIMAHMEFEQETSLSDERGLIKARIRKLRGSGKI